MRKKLLYVFLFLLVLAVLWGCDRAEQTMGTVETVNQNPEKAVSHTTSGTIESKELIGVVFSEPQVDEEDLEKPVTNDGVFEFEPDIEGEIFWRDTRTIVFKSDKPLKEKERYRATLHINKLFPDIEEVKPEKEIFEFETVGQFIEDFSGGFRVTGEGDSPPEFRGEIVFHQKEDVETVEEAMKFSDGEEDYDLQVETVDNRRFNISSEQIKRGEEEKEFNFTADSEVLKLEEDYNEKYSLSPAGYFGINRIEEVKTGDYSELRVIFSDPLDPDADYRPYVRVEPEMDVDFEVDGREMVISGEFEPGQKYELTFLSGLQSELGAKLQTDNDCRVEIEISDIKPAVEFSGSGMYLTSGKNQKIAFRSMNLERVRVTVNEVEEDNLIDYMESDLYEASGAYNYDGYSFRDYGKTVATRLLDIDAKKNRWIQSELDLSELIDEEAGLYSVRFDFEPEDALYFPEKWSSGQINEYINSEAPAFKNLILSDLGIVAKETKEGFQVFVTDIMKAAPVEDIKVQLKDDENRSLESEYTDGDGSCTLSGHEDAEYIEVNRRYERSILKISDSRLDYSLFKTGGIKAKSGIKAFLYTARGVYRPGDKINLSLIARDRDDTFPDDQPVNLRLYNPQDKLMEEKTAEGGKDGFYSFELSTEMNAPTGEWLAEVDVAGETFSEIIRIEEIVPYRIEADIEPEKEELTPEDENLNFTLSSEYLFGSPAAGLESKTRITVEPYEKFFERYSDFVFANRSIILDEEESREFEQKLDDEGQTEISWELPDTGQVPSALRAVINSHVVQKGGRQVPEKENIPIKVYDRFVGIRRLNDDSVRMGSDVDFDVVLVDEEGDPVTDTELEYKLYRMRRYWWWDYGNEDEFRRHFKSDEDTEIIKQGTLNTGNGGQAVMSYNLDDYGQMLLEVKDPEGGHSAGYFFRSHWWGGASESSGADVIELRSGQDEYHPGEEAELVMDTPEEGRILLTVERGGKVLHQSWEELQGETTEITLPVKEEYVPNVYVYASVFQAYKDLDNDAPIRMYGVLPLKVEREDSSLDFEIDTPEEIRPNSEFEVNIDADKQARFTVAVIDEGLLDITDFDTPDPHNYFYARERLDVKSYDIFDDVIGLTEGYIYNTFSVGGDERLSEGDYRDKQEGSEEEGDRRFEPVALFEGPVETDEDGNLDLSFTMPNYNGRVRVMAVGAEGSSYGSDSEDVVVKAPLMILPTLPRILAPEDKFEVPVTVFYNEEEPADIEVSMKTEGRVNTIGEEVKTLSFDGPGEKDVYFDARAEDAVGDAKVEIEAAGDGFSTDKEVNLEVRPVNPYTYLSEDKVVDSQDDGSYTVPNEGVENTSDALLSISRRKGLDINHRLNWLLRYPYGCIEQTTSSVFPQLYLEELFDLSHDKLVEIDENINGGIERLRKFQVSSGGFSYWPNRNTANLWGSNYAGHFLLEARDQGYHVPRDMYSDWLEFQVNKSKENEGNLLTQSYRLYLLARAGEPETSAMNYLRESQLEHMDNTAGFYLAAAYQLTGHEDAAREILDSFAPEVEEEVDIEETYGSRLRNKAIMLEVMTLFGNYDRALKLYNDIAENISSDKWLSTQETGYSLMAAAKYVLESEEEDDEYAGGRIIFPDGSEREFELTGAVDRFPLDDCFGKEVQLVNESDRPLYSSLEWEGVPERDSLEPESKNLNLTVDWFNEEGELIDPGEIRQGETFWGRFRISKDENRALSDVALVQILPSGWEIENVRLLDGDFPGWMDDYELENEDYVDIRDDRIMWFFDFGRYDHHYDFVVKLNTVTAGEFYLPPAAAEMMYNNNYKAVLEGREVRVIRNE
ncbi:MAG: alpha-2-macroglobulin family protein [Bacillota bacterium]